MIDYNTLTKDYPLPNQDGIDLGQLDPYNSPDMIIEFMYRWVSDMDSIIWKEYQQNKYSIRYQKLIKERGITYEEYEVLFAPVSEEEYGKYIVFEYLQIENDVQKHRFTHRYSNDKIGYTNFIKAQALPVMSFFFGRHRARLIREYRKLHSYIVAKSRAGKTTLMKTIILDDIKNKRKRESILVLDPHGSLAKELRRLKAIPKEDLVYLDIATISTHIPCLNIFDQKDKSEDAISANTDFILMAFSELLADYGFTGTMVRVIRHCITSMLYNDGTDLYTLLNVLKILNNNKRKQDFTAEERDLIESCAEVPYTQTKEFFTSDWQAVDQRTYNAIIERVDGILSHPRVRRFLVGETTFDLQKMLNSGKVVIVNLDFTKLGDLGSEAVGRIIVAEAQKAVKSRSGMEFMPSTRMFIDECQRFMTKTVESALSEFGKYNVSLCVAHQYAEQMDRDMLKALLANTYTKIVGANSASNASVMASEMRVPAEQLTAIPKYNFQLNVDGQDKGIFKSSDSINNPSKYYTEEEAEEIDKYMISKYYKPIMIQAGSSEASDDIGQLSTPFEATNFEIAKNEIDFYGQEKPEWIDEIDFSIEIEKPGTRKQKLIESLGRFKFLTVSQFARIGIGKTRSNISPLLKELSDSNLKEPKIGSIPAKTRMEEVAYCLTQYGAELVAGNLDTQIENIKAPRTIPKEQTRKLAGHDRHAIDCHIELYETCEKYGIEIRLHDNDFDTIGSVRKGNNLERLTRLNISNGYLEPDSIFKLATPRGMLMYLFEMEMRDNRNHKDLIEKVDKYVDTINVHAVKDKYNFPYSPRVLMVFKEASTMDFVLKHLKENIKGSEFWFLCKLYEDVVPSKEVQGGAFTFGDYKNFFKGWTTTDGIIDMF